MKKTELIVLIAIFVLVTTFFILKNNPNNSGCKPEWSCSVFSSWSGNNCGSRTRTCEDVNKCNDDVTKPISTEIIICSGGNSGSCTSNWDCVYQEWSNKDYSCGTREGFCHDKNNCVSDKPITETMPCPCFPDWQCSDYGAWSDLSNNCGTRSRVCSDMNTCNDLTGMPSESESKTCTTNFKTYYVSNSGSDTNDGLSIVTPIKTIAKVNTLSLQPGDSVLFARGNTWRESLNYSGQSGTTTNKITFGAYGIGNKPKLYGSINGDSASFWTSLGNNRWSTPLIFPLEVYQIFYNTKIEPKMGTRRTSDSALTTNWDFMWSGNKIVIYNTENPANVGNGIELPEYDAFYQTLIWFERKENIIVKDLEISYTRYRAIGDHLGNNNEFKNIDFKYGYEKTMWMEGNNEIIDGNTFYLCGIRGQPIPYGLDAQGENIWVLNNLNPTVSNNKIERCGGVCINLFHTKGGVTTGNEVFNCQQSPTDWSGGIYYDGCSDSILSSNIIKDCQIGIAVGAEISGTSSKDITVKDNIVIGSAIAELVVDSRANMNTNLNINHNTFYKNDYTTGSGFGNEIFLKQFNNVSFTENIIYNDYTNTGVGQLLLVTGTNFVSNNNLWYSKVGRNAFNINSVFYSSFANYKTGTGQDSNSLNTDPSLDLNYKPGSTICNIGAVKC